MHILFACSCSLVLQVNTQINNHEQCLKSAGAVRGTEYRYFWKFRVIVSALQPRNKYLNSHYFIA